MSQLPSIRLRPSETEFLETQSFTEGSVFYDKNKNTLVLMNGREQGGFELLRADLSNATTGLGVEVSASPPNDARPGSLWLDTQTGELFIYLNDGDSEQWVQPSTAVYAVSADVGTTYAVTVAGPQNLDTGNKYLLNGSYRLIPNFIVGNTYVFVQDNPTNVYFPNVTGTNPNPHPLNFSADNISGELGGGTSYLSGVEYRLNGLVVTQAVYNSSSFNSATTRRVSITVSNTTPATLYYWCYNHQAMGSSITVTNPNAPASGLEYILPTASTTVLGGVRIDGTSIVINNGVISSVSSGESGASSNTFSTVAVTGQTNIIATSSTDTLRLAAGSNITLTTNAINKTVTISSTGTSSGIALTSLSVAVNSASGSGNLIYNNSTGVFTFTPPIFPTTLTTLLDVDIVTPTNGQVLKYNSGTARWVNASDLTGDGGTGIGLSDLSVTTASASGSGSLSYSNTTGIFTFTPPNLASFITLSSIAASGDISYNNATGAISFNNSTGYITRAGISVTQSAASGNGSLAYSNSTGVFTFTPPDLSSVGGGTASDSFTTIVVSGQSNVVADSSTDTLTIVAGAGIAVTTNASTDTITIASTVSSGATAFTGLSDRADLTVDQFYLPAITRLNTTNNGASSYRFDQYSTTDNPIVYAINATTIAFNLNVAGHPFLIQTAGGSNYNEGLVHVTTSGFVTTGSAAQGKTSGTLYWKIPRSISGNYRYICSIHSGMVGTITIKDFVNI